MESRIAAPCFAAVLVSFVCVFPGRLCAADPRVNKPPEFANAQNHLRVKFLPEERDWERVDVYVPAVPKEERLPCVVFFYGGGWGSKVS
jgi:acetyl esterase/lipase